MSSRPAHTSGSAAANADDRAVLQLLQRRRAMTVRDFCEEFNVTATAVRQRLTRLTAGGCIIREADRDGDSGRGRPSYRYRLTEHGRRQLGDNYAELAGSLWRAVLDEPDEALRSALLLRLQQVLVARYGSGVDADSVEERVRQLSEALRTHGYATEYATGSNGSGGETSDPDQLPILREHHCPYYDLAADDPTLCQLEEAVFSQIVGSELKLDSCCRDGDSCCEFKPA